MHLMIAGGGTGGHLFPGVAVAEEFLEQNPGAQVTFVGTERGIEARVIPSLGFDLELIEVQALKGGGPLKKAASLLNLPKSGWAARRLLKRLAPDVVVSVGGYAAGPVTFMASRMGIPTALMEQNSYPGMTNRLLGRVVDHAYLTFPQSAQFFEKTEYTVPGNPIRRGLIEQARDFRYRAPAEGGPFNILIIGGSGGAGSFNEFIPAWLSDMGDLTERLVVKHQAGRGRKEEVIPGYEGFRGEVEVLEFIDDMAAAYSWCDLLICRAGASTIAEVLALGIPAIYIPFPQAADDHQRANALSIVEGGAGVMIDDQDLDSARSRNLLAGFIHNPIALENLAGRARQMSRIDAGQVIAQDLKRLIQSR